MFDEKPLTRMVSCPKCGLFQLITFEYNSVGVDQRCIGCGEYALFELPTAMSSIINAVKRYFG